MSDSPEIGGIQNCHDYNRITAPGTDTGKEVRKLEEITDEHVLECSKIIGGNDHISDESKIYQFRELFCTNKLYNQQTNIPGIRWYRVFKYLESKGYIIEPAPAG